MKKLFKGIVTVCLALAMIVTMIAPVTAEAATKSQTMYVGEVFEGHIYGTTIKSVSSSNKKIVKVTKSKDYKFAYIMEAKKAGTATLTVKYKDYKGTKTQKIKITVKKTDIKLTAQKLDGGYVLVKVKNNTKQTFDSIKYQYTIKDVNGETIKEDTTTALRVLSGKTAYDTIYVGKDFDVDCSLTGFKITDISRNPNYTYKNATKDQVVITQIDTETEGNTISFRLKRKNTLKKEVYGVNYLVMYDAENQIIGVDRCIFSLGSKETATSSKLSIYHSEYSNPTYDHYEVVTQAYSVTKK